MLLDGRRQRLLDAAGLLREVASGGLFEDPVREAGVLRGVRAELTRAIAEIEREATVAQAAVEVHGGGS